MEKKFVIYRILVVRAGGGRHCKAVDIHTDDIEKTRMEFKRHIEEYLPVEKIFFSYHEKEEEP